MKQTNNFKANWKNLYIIFISIWCIDFLTTIISLNLPRYAGKLYETNPLSAWLFGFGFIGWVGAFVYSMTTIFLISYSVCWLLNKRIKTDDLRFNLYLAVLFIFILFEGNAIFNNLGLLMANF